MLHLQKCVQFLQHSHKAYSTVNHKFVSGVFSWILKQLMIQLQVRWLMKLSLNWSSHWSHKVKKGVVIYLKMKNWKTADLHKSADSKFFSSNTMKISTQYYILTLRRWRKLKLSSSNERKLGMMFKKNPGTIKSRACYQFITAGTPFLLSIVKTVIHLYGLWGCWPRKKPLLHSQHLQVWLKFAAARI